MSTWSLRAKLLIFGLSVPAVLVALLLGAYAWHAKEQSVDELAGKARAICVTAEATREGMEDKWRVGLLSADLLKTIAKEADKAKAQERILEAVPVVSAMNAVRKKAKEGGYQFKVPKNHPRNPDNQPDAVEEAVLRELGDGTVPGDGALREKIVVDKVHNAVRYFRPVVLTETCLFCHGSKDNPKHNIWGTTDGKDITGGPMEDWKAGEVHGAFELIQSLDANDAVLNRQLALAVAICAALLAVVGLCGGILLDRAISRPVMAVCDRLRQGAGEVSSAADQVSSLSQNIAQGASQQAANLEETAASLTTLADSARTNAGNVRRADALANTASTSAEQGQGEAKRIAAGIRVSMGRLLESIQAVKRSTDETAQLVESIDGIAFQTNLLALNAAVEAARAGEAGQGFAVVADEVRNLAQRSADEVKTSNARLREAQDATGRVQDAATEVEKAIAIALEQRVPEVFDGLVQNAKQVAELMAQVATGSDQQAKGVEQITTAAGELDRITQGNAASAEESAASSEELSAQATSLRTTVEQLARFVHGGTRDQG